MERFIELIEALNEARQNMTGLKLWLSQKEVVEYFNWKQENEKDRTAMDKVIAQLKMQDEEWLLKESEYYQWKNRYEYVKNVYDIASGMLNNPDNFTKDDIYSFISQAL